MKRLFLYAFILFALIFNPLLNALADEQAQSFFGQEVNVLGENIAFSQTRFQDADELRSFCENFPNAKRIDIGLTNLLNEDLALIRAEYDSFELVWTMKFGKWEIKTDATAFSTKNVGGAHRRYSSTFECLKYCTNLLALDLGHNSIRDLGFLEGLTKLRYLILVDNEITDVSVLSTMPDLQYIELFMNYDLRDLSPLSELENLVDLNICYCNVRDYEIFETMPQLERLWFSNGRIKNNTDMQKFIRSCFDDCVTNFTTTSSTAEGWREHPHYFAVRDTFGGGSFIDWDEYVPVDDPVIQ